MRWLMNPFWLKCGHLRKQMSSEIQYNITTTQWWDLKPSAFQHDIVYHRGQDNSGWCASPTCCAPNSGRLDLYQLHASLCHPGDTRMLHFVRARNFPFAVQQVKEMIFCCRIWAEVKAPLATTGTSLPSWLLNLNRVLLKNQNQRSRYGRLVAWLQPKLRSSTTPRRSWGFCFVRKIGTIVLDPGSTLGSHSLPSVSDHRVSDNNLTDTSHNSDVDRRQSVESLLQQHLRPYFLRNREG